ncbi:sugar 3,4-ketoisomerase [Romboutsia sp. Marseille-P6047]|uniref:sugar 3,4-ketoisomerase n=1 Tax=Romboutsia sp. Marseille-P6047 TaxID=2161817 RepID=UPI000F04ED90|nr:FdtA/QdtA family cupin domain-containing protein [Romboutsia sp. Marseille-P6047]
MKSSYKFNLNKKENNGILVPLEEDFNILFEIKRVFYTYKVPNNESRGNHAYFKTKQVLICVSGSVEVRCFDGIKESVYKLDNPSQGIYIDPKVWRTTYNHSDDCVVLIISSNSYDESDYIRDYKKFLEEVKCI